MAKRFCFQELVLEQHYYLKFTKSKMRSNTYTNIRETSYSNTNRSLVQGPRQTILNQFKAVVPEIRNKMNTQVAQAAEGILQYVQNHNCHCARSFQEAQREASNSRTQLQTTSIITKTNKPINHQHSNFSPIKMSRHQAEPQQSITKFAKSKKKLKSETSRQKYVPVNQLISVNQQYPNRKKQRTKSTQKFRKRHTEEGIYHQQTRENKYLNYNQDLKFVIEERKRLIDQIKRLELSEQKISKVVVHIEKPLQNIKKQRKELKQYISKHSKSIQIQQIQQADISDSQNKIQKHQETEKNPAQINCISYEENVPQQVQNPQRQLDQQIVFNVPHQENIQQTSQINQDNPQFLTEIAQKYDDFFKYMPQKQSRIREYVKQREVQYIKEEITKKQPNILENSPPSQYSSANRLYRLQASRKSQMKQKEQIILIQLKNSRRKLDNSTRKNQMLLRELEASRRKNEENEDKLDQINIRLQSVKQISASEDKPIDEQLCRIILFQAQKIEKMCRK